MSISPPVDIVLDVARAADPVRYKDAVARLTRIAAPTDPSAPADPSFDSLVGPVGPAAPDAVTTRPSARP